jgi:hypothetical protein
MDQYAAEVCFGSKEDLRAAAANYNSCALRFQKGLREIAARHEAYLKEKRTTLGVETIDNFETCTIHLKPLQATLPAEIQHEVIELFNTTWSQ